jgi:hypothetical protein
MLSFDVITKVGFEDMFDCSRITEFDDGRCQGQEKDMRVVGGGLGSVYKSWI